MRPRKIILLFCADEHERSVLKLILQLRPYRVIAGISALPPLPALIIVVDDRTLATVTAARRISELHPAIPTLVIPDARSRRRPDCYPCHFEVLPRDWKPIWLVERARILVAKKRGPKPGSRHAGMYMAGVA